ncbi:metallophosphoesterase [Dysgonomonas sp. Marseille-P4677]|uniref:metallophosphoesterase n=1 Tax=Dysgonomonas sp. Marseille-P4677 TaxID=2364790 RepID=UPI001911C2C2|nr:metallophosphoesterase [Dysgonomonas sp. Marseille-P4677]MBK5719508.1 metallophosphoesterase [Dysgonomonas sp. Marseille-P4677]
MKSIMFIIIFIIYLLANIYVFYHIWIAMPANAMGRTALISFIVIAVSSFFISFLAGDVLPIWLAATFYKIGTAWLFILLYFFMVMAVKDIFGLTNRLLHFMPVDAITRYTKENWVGLGFMVGFITLLMFCGYLKYQWKVRVELPIQTYKTIGDSTSTRSLRIVAISDLHLGYGIGKKEFEGWVNIINSENPDIVLIAGDIIDSSVRPLNDEGYDDVFRKIKAPYGVYTCLGNHEYISGIKGSLDFIDKTGVTLLRDAVAFVDSSFYVIGRDDRSNPNRKPLRDLVADLDKSKPIIMLDHQPYDLEETEAYGIDFQFSGHTHQGQVWPISLITKSIYENDHGFVKKGNSNIYVSSGIGIWGGKFRIGTQSEYVVIDINKKQ